MIGQPVLDQSEGPDPEHHVAIELRLPGDQVAHHVGAHHLLVHGVGFDVLAVERDALLRGAQPLQRLRPSGATRVAR